MQCTSPSRLILGFAILFALACSPGGPGGAPPDGGGRADGGRLPSTADADMDGISDDDEGRRDDIDTDADGVPDYLDDDSDGDGIGDRLEAGDEDVATAPRDSDSDGTPDFRDTDSDDNEIGRAHG